MATFNQVAKSLRAVAKNVPQNANIIVRKVALAIDQAVVLGTPVDTGRARSNWQVSIDAPATGTVEPFAKELPDKVGAAADSGTFAINSAIAATKGFAGGSIFIVNNLPYIIPLNEGHSQQAQPGYIQNAILNGIRAVRSVKLLEPPQKDGD